MGKGKRATLFTPPISKCLPIVGVEPFIAGSNKKHPNVKVSDTGAKEGEFSHRRSSHYEQEEIPEVPMTVVLTTYLSYVILLAVGHLRDFFGMIFKSSEYESYKMNNGYAPIVSGFESLYHRRLYKRIQDVFHRPITGVAGRTVKVLERASKDYNQSLQLTGNVVEVLNLSSYNYLGFAQSDGPCADSVVEAIKEYGISSASPRNQGGSTEIIKEGEKLVSRFVGKPDAVLISQGFSTNSTVLPVLASKGSLIISDELNHSSIVFGARLSGANIKVYKHGDLKELEKVLRDSIAQGQPKTHRPWKKIILVIEGLYSMEGSLPKLPSILELKKRYKFYIYLDEAHSIGAMGPRGRGICDYFGVNPSVIDVMMGTFTKSFGAAGGYIAADKKLISRLRVTNHSNIYAETISIPVVQQMISSMKIILGEQGGCDGQRRLETLAFNSRYFSSELRKMGFTVYGSPDSPVVPVLLYHPAKIAAFSRECLNRGIAVVTVSYPATHILTARVRFCVSAAHTKHSLDWALKEISQIGDQMLLKN